MAEGSSMTRGVLNLSYARESEVGVNRVFLRGKLISDHDLFSSYESQQGVVDG